MSQIRLFNDNPTGDMRNLNGCDGSWEGGIAGCGNAQNCVRVCPKKIPLTESLSIIGREASKQAIKDFLSLPDAEK